MISKIKSFFQESIQELKRVDWPTRQETTRLTIIVIIISLAVAIFLGALDFAFTRLLQLFLK